MPNLKKLGIDHLKPTSFGDECENDCADPDDYDCNPSDCVDCGGGDCGYPDCTGYP